MIALAPAPPIDMVRPAWVAVVPGYGSRHVPARLKVPSDVQCYSTRDGGSYRQVNDDPAGPAWLTYRGRAIAAYDPVNRDFIAMSSAPVLCAAFGG